MSDYIMKSWDDYTPLEQAHQLYSDYYKDVNGFRPRNDVSNWTLEDFDEAMESLSKEMEIVMKEKEEMQNEAALAFEALIEQTIAHGAIDKVNALKWLRQAEDDCYYEFDDGYFEYTHHLPYGYLKEHGYVS